MHDSRTHSHPDSPAQEKLDEMRRKAAQLEAAQQVEQRIIREAQRRQLEDSGGKGSRSAVRGGASPSPRPSPSPVTAVSGSGGPAIHASRPSSQHHRARVVEAPPPLPQTSPPDELNGSRRLDNLINNADGTERVSIGYLLDWHLPWAVEMSSFVLSAQGRLDFNANLPTSSRPPSATHPEIFLSEATEMLAQTSPFDSSNAGPGAQSTPGVIGAQEVYRDPRQRRLAEKAKAAADPSLPNPEKLTFREKMRMFAVESGEQATPKDRSKISKAQREIED